jgi:hypothetical protein
MSELGALLELIHEAHSRLISFQAEYRDWARSRPSLEVTIDRSERGDADLHWRGAGPFPSEAAATRRFWLKRPDCLRVEILRNNLLTRFAILNRDRWWRWDRADGAVIGEARSQNHGSLRLPPLLSPPLLEPIRLLPRLELDTTGRGWRAGRETLCARARPRDSTSSGGAFSYELEFDAEHGTLLRYAVFDAGTLVSLSEAIAVTCDADIDPQRFVFVAPDGKPARPFRDAIAAPPDEGGVVSGQEQPIVGGRVSLGRVL